MGEKIIRDRFFESIRELTFKNCIKIFQSIYALNLTNNNML